MADPDSILQHNMKLMGDALGTQFTILWRQLARLYIKWFEFVELFGTEVERIDLYNRTAASFFGLIQNELWDSILLHIARLTDPAKTGTKENLSLQVLPSLISDHATSVKVQALIERARMESEFCRDTRNRRIAHNDLAVALGVPAVPLTSPSRKHVEAVLKTMAEAINTVETHFALGKTAYEFIEPTEGALHLIHIIELGTKARDEAVDRWKALGLMT